MNLFICRVGVLFPIHRMVPHIWCPNSVCWYNKYASLPLCTCFLIFLPLKIGFVSQCVWFESYTNTKMDSCCCFAWWATMIHTRRVQFNLVCGNQLACIWCFWVCWICVCLGVISSGCVISRQHQTLWCMCIYSDYLIGLPRNNVFPPISVQLKTQKINLPCTNHLVLW